MSKAKPKLRHNVRKSSWLLLAPVIGLSFVIWLVYSYQPHQRYINRRSLQSKASGVMATQITKNQPSIERMFAYYEVQQNDTLPKLLTHFGISADTYAKYNGTTPVVGGTVIKIPPVEAPLTDIASTPINPAAVTVSVHDNGVYVKASTKFPLTVTTIPELAAYLRQYGVLTQTGPKDWRINKTLELQDNIRLNITSKTVSSIAIASPKGTANCLCGDNNEFLFSGVKVTTYDPVTKTVDKDSSDFRSFVRMRLSGRMDIMNSEFSYLGNGIATDKSQLIERQGGTYGISWRINDNTLGKNLVTGWVENNSFHNNYFGSFTFGASGITWRKNHYFNNERYGLDPHDDSNNALVEDNLFENNGTHGFIVSKRCMNNIIRNNISRNNKLHGFMLHENSNFNIIENNQSYGNADNIAIYNSDDNLIRNNSLSNARISNVRISNGSTANFILNNNITGHGRGIYAYTNVSKLYVAYNIVKNSEVQVASKDNVNELFYVKNKSQSNFKNENLQNSLITNI